MSTIVYSAQTSGFEPGVRYCNPYYFSRPKKGVSRVLIVGNWPDVREAYEALGVPVDVVAHAAPIRNPGSIPPPPATGTPERDLATARAEYTAATGKKYYHGWDYDELMRRIREAGEA